MVRAFCSVLIGSCLVWVIQSNTEGTYDNVTQLIHNNSFDEAVTEVSIVELNRTSDEIVEAFDGNLINDENVVTLLDKLPDRNHGYLQLAEKLLRNKTFNSTPGFTLFYRAKHGNSSADLQSKIDQVDFETKKIFTNFPWTSPFKVNNYKFDEIMFTSSNNYSSNESMADVAKPKPRKVYAIDEENAFFFSDYKTAPYWTLETYNNGLTFYLRNTLTGGYLYAGDSDQITNGVKRRVFVSNGERKDYGEWQIQPASGGKYRIKNYQLNEYLSGSEEYSNFHTLYRRIFTRGECEGEQCIWEFVEVESTTIPESKTE